MVEPVLVGRDAEREAIGRLLTTATLGVGGTLVVLGEPGVGKTALIEDAVTGREDLRLLRATGLDAERHLPFAGLLQLLRPTLDHLCDLPAPQAAALSAALGLAEVQPGHGDRFMIGAAVLSLLSRCAEETPVVVVVDDLHTLDRPSAEAVLFAARRLAADRVALLAAARTPEGDSLTAGLPVLRLEGLSDGAATALVNREAGGTAVPPGRLEPLLALAGGNPLALLELAGDDDLEGLAVDLVQQVDLPARVPQAVTAAFARRLDQLSAPCRTALLVAAVCGGDLSLVTRACTALGVAADALAEAEDAGMITLAAGHAEFRHPLARASAYSGAGAQERRAAHAAVAHALPVDDTDRRAWHLAESAWEPDGDIADLLAAAGERARQRTAYSVASRAFERSARLSTAPGRRAERLLDAADAAWSAGLTGRASALLDSHAREAAATVGQVRELALRGGIAARTGGLRDAREMLLAAADLSTDPNQQCVLLAEAMHANFYLAGAPTASLLARRLDLLTAEATDPGALSLARTAIGLARIIAGEEGGADDLRAAVPLILANRELFTDPHWLSFLMQVPLYLRDATEARTLRSFVEQVREEAGVGALPALLFALARDQATTSSWSEAVANYSESVRLAEETGQVTERLMSTAGLCWLESRQGQEDACRAHAAEVLRQPVDVHLHIAVVWVHYALGDLLLSLGEPARAVTELRRLTALLEEHEMGDVDLVPGPELVDALLRTGQRAEAETAASVYERAAQAKGQPWALARAARARGLVAEDDGEARRCFERALETHAATLDRFETGRTRLAYGERLRRAGRRVDARAQLRPALDDFEELGAERWAERAAAELAATGESVHRRGADPRSLLTAQELQVSMLLVEGRTTREAAAALFLSPKTVEYHLRKVYTKLDLRSRAELAKVLGV